MTVPLLYCPTCGAANSATESVCFACNNQLTQTMDEQADDFLLQGRYQVLNQVGTGGFGAVYKARDIQQNNQVVAVKQINLRGLTPQETIEATDGFNREVQLLSTLSHEHLPHIYDHFTDPEHWYLVMDFIAGETLEHYLTDEAVSQWAIRMLSFDEILDIALQLCDVLYYLHTRQPVVIFRDLKPSNIMRTPASKLYLIDFGIARRFTPGKLKDTIPLGSPGYAAPEQYGKAQTTPRADIYSLGALLHHLLSGIDPAETPFTFPPLRLYGSTGLAELEAMINRMVALDASKRPGSIAEVQEELQRIVALRSNIEAPLWHLQSSLNTTATSQTNSWHTTSFGTPISPGSSVLQGQQQKIHLLKTRPSSRRKLIVNGLAITAGLLIGGGPALSSALRSQVNTDAPPMSNTSPSYTTSNLTNDPEKEVYKYLSPINAMTWSPDGNYLALTASDSTIHIWHTKTWQRHFFSSTDTVNSLSWSPDSTMLASATNKMLQIWNAQHGKILYQQSGIPQSKQSMHTSVLWAPGGNRLALASDDGSLHLLDINNPQRVKPLNVYKSTPARSGKQLIAWSPDGSLIAVNAYKMLQVRSASNGAIASVFRSKEYDFIALNWSPHSSSIATASGDRIVQLWDQGTDTLLANYDTADDMNSSVINLAWSADGRYLAATAISGNLYFWDTQQQQPQPFAIYNATRPAIASLISWSPKEPRIAVSYDDGRCLIWRAPIVQ